MPPRGRRGGVSIMAIGLPVIARTVKGGEVAYDHLKNQRRSAMVNRRRRSINHPLIVGLALHGIDTSRLRTFETHFAASG